MNSRKPRALVKRLLADESGQATTEYVLLIAVLVGIIMTLGKAFKEKMNGFVQGPLARRIQNEMFNTNRIHQFRM